MLSGLENTNDSPNGSGDIEMSNRRPASGHSQSAWGNDGNSERMNSSGGKDTFQKMEQNCFTPNNKADSFENQRQDEKILVPPEIGCCGKFLKGIRNLWATRLTEDTKHDQELYVKTTLRELIMYCAFLITLGIAAHGMVTSDMYFFTKSMESLFLDSSFEDNSNTFRRMSALPEFWKFAESPLLGGLYQERWYNGQNMTDTELGYVLLENRLLGLPRIRQLQVSNHSCDVHDDFKNEIKECFDAYSKQVEFKDPYGKFNGSAWTYEDENDLNAGSHWGKVSTYGGGGYTTNLGSTEEESRIILADLRKNLWINRGTRVVFVDFTVYNANLNLFCVSRLTIEFPATGGILPSWHFRTLKLLRYVNTMDYFVLVCECIFMLFVLYYIIEEAIEIKKHKCSYFRSVWNILDLVLIVTAIVCAGFNLYRTISVTDKLEQLLYNQHQFMDMEFLSYWQVAFNHAVAWMVFFAWIKIFKYISFNKTMTQLSSTLARCAKDLAGFTVMFFIIFFAFGQLGYLIFGTQVKDFRSFGYACVSQFRIILGDFDFHELERANRVLGPLYFITYVFFVFFVLMNMFLAIINDTYAEVKVDLYNQKNEFEMADYVKKSYSVFRDRMIANKDQLRSLEKALQAASVDGSSKVDFEEWRYRLKMQGHTESEIEAIFAKYDYDGDRILDQEDQAHNRESRSAEKQFRNLEFSPEGGHFDSDCSDVEDSKSVTGQDRSTPGVTYENFTILSRRVDRMEHSIGSVMSKIDAVLVKLETILLCPCV